MRTELSPARVDLADTDPTVAEVAERLKVNDDTVGGCSSMNLASSFCTDRAKAGASIARYVFPSAFTTGC